MNESNENPRRYKWPWFVLAAVLLAVVLAIVWMRYAVKREEQQRDFSAPIQTR
jgi:cytochrome oxidase assembly protein ShyY1